MDAHMRQSFARVLSQRRRELLGTLISEEEQLEWLEQDRESEFTERGQEARAAEVLARLDDRARAELAEVEAALDRLRRGRYGICEDCGRPLPVDRLQSMPAARRCAECQRTADASSSAG